jgi:glycosyltransferase involved in cell wall biosynthesis
MMFSDQDDPTSFKVVHCGLEMRKYDFRMPKREVKYLFCVARLSSEKGLSFLIQGLKLLRDRGLDLELRLAGDGPRRIQLEQTARSLGISNYVHFLGYLTEDAVISELRDADIFVLPSFIEGLPVSAMEAMAVGLPVIATNIAGTSELVEDGKNGVLIRPSDAQALADAVVRLIEDYDFRQRAANLARAKVVNEFDVDQESAKLRMHFLTTSNP